MLEVLIDYISTKQPEEMVNILLIKIYFWINSFKNRKIKYDLELEYLYQCLHNSIEVLISFNEKYNEN